MAAAHSRPPLRPPPGHSSTAGTRRSATRRTSWPTTRVLRHRPREHQRWHWKGGGAATGEAATGGGAAGGGDGGGVRGIRWSASDNTDYGSTSLGSGAHWRSFRSGRRSYTCPCCEPVSTATGRGCKSTDRRATVDGRLLEAHLRPDAPCTTAVVDVAGRRGRRRDGHWRGRRRGRQRRGGGGGYGSHVRMRAAAEASVLDVGGLVRAATGARVGEAQAHVTSL